jgi:hypothetical protein
MTGQLILAVVLALGVWWYFWAVAYFVMEKPNSREWAQRACEEETDRDQEGWDRLEAEDRRIYGWVFGIGCVVLFVWWLLER